MPYMLMDHEGKDPRQEIYTKVGMTKLGEIPGFGLLRNDVLLGIYMRPEKTASGIHLTQQYRKEDENQGKAALVLVLGPTAFASDVYANFDDPRRKVEPGDWVSIWVSDGRQINVNGHPCRIIEDQQIVMKIPAPDAIF